MSITILGLIFIPLTIFLWLKKPSYLLPVACFSGIFQGSSIFNIESASLSITPYYFILTTISIVFFANLLSGKIRKLNQPKYLKIFTVFLIILTIWSCVSLSLPLIFSSLKVYVPNEGIDTIPDRLKWSSSNVAQFIYLIENVIFLKFLTKEKFYNLKKYTKFILVSGIVVIFFGFCQVLDMHYIVDIFRNNMKAAETQYSDFGFSRISAFFPEASYAGGFLTSISTISVLNLVNAHKISINYLLLSMLSMLALMFTFSSTGYFGFALMVILITAKLVQLFLRRDIYFKLKVISLLVFILISSILFLRENYFIVEVFGNVMISKKDSFSGINRFAADMHSLGLFFQTYGLGVGIGSNRPSSFFAWLSSNLGIFGVIFYISCLAIPLMHSRQKGWKNIFFIMHISNLICMTISIPDLSWPYLWIFMGLSLVSYKESNESSIQENV
jgi:hypothetical protein